jgi:thioredoxin-related protein
MLFYVSDLSLVIQHPVFSLYVSILIITNIKFSIPIRVSVSLIISIFWAFYIFPGTAIFQERKIFNNVSLFADSISLLPHNIHDFVFLSKNLDTIKLKSGLPMVIETWNESCLPCLKSIKNLREEFLLHQEYFNHYLLYENTKYPDTLNISYLSAKSIVSHNENLLFDLNFRYYKDLNIQLYPVFIFYDKNGEYITNMVGYSEKKHENFIKELRKNIFSISVLN